LEVWPYERNADAIRVVAANNGRYAAWSRTSAPVLRATWVDPEGALRVARFDHRTLKWTDGSATTRRYTSSASSLFVQFAFPVLWARTDGAMVAAALVLRDTALGAVTWAINTYTMLDDDIGAAAITKVYESEPMEGDYTAKYLTADGGATGLYAVTVPGVTSRLIASDLVTGAFHAELDDRYARAYTAPVGLDGAEIPESPLEGPPEPGFVAYRQSDPSVCATPDGAFVLVAHEQQEAPDVPGSEEVIGTRIFVRKLSMVAGGDTTEDVPGVEVEWRGSPDSKEPEKYGGDVCVAATNNAVYLAHQGQRGSITLLRKNMADIGDGKVLWQQLEFPRTDLAEGTPAWIIGDGWLPSISVVAVTLPNGAEEERVALVWQQTSGDLLWDSRHKTVELIMVSWAGGAFGTPVVQKWPAGSPAEGVRIACMVVIAPPELEAQLGYHPVDVFWLYIDPPFHLDLELPRGARSFTGDPQLEVTSFRLQHATYRFLGGCVS
jgi:hypothetical protein